MIFSGICQKEDPKGIFAVPEHFWRLFTPEQRVAWNELPQNVKGQRLRDSREHQFVRDIFGELLDMSELTGLVFLEFLFR